MKSRACTHTAYTWIQRRIAAQKHSPCDRCAACEREAGPSRSHGMTCRGPGSHLRSMLDILLPSSVTVSQEKSHYGRYMSCRPHTGAV